MTDIPMDKCAELCELTRKVNKLDTELRGLKALKEALACELATEFALAGVQSTKLDSGETLYSRSDFFCNKRAGVEVSEIVQALRQELLEDFTRVDYSPSQLKAYLKEQVKQMQEERPDASPQDALPESLRDLVNVGEIVRVIVTGA